MATNLYDLPPEILKIIFDFLEPKELENCRYLCQRLYEFFDDYPRTCRKTLDLSSLAIVYGEPVVELFSNTKKNVEKLIMDENSIIKNVDKFFTQLGMSVKELMIGKDSLYAMSDRTFKTVVQKFTHVERLRLDNVYLLYRLQELKLIWKSVKKLELQSAKNWFLLTTKEAVRYNGDFRELPQLKEITLVGLNSKNLNFVKRFAPKIISIEDVDLMQISKTVCDEFLETGLNLIEMDVHFNHPLREQQFSSFFDTQPKLTTLKVQVTSVDHRRWMPSVDFSRITSLHIQLLFERLDLRLIQNLPNLHEFRIQSDNLDIELFDEESACFLTDHRQIDNFSVNFLRIDPLHYDCCMQCLKYLILSFNNVTELYVNAEPRCGTGFWLPLMVLLQDHKINEKLEVLKMETIRSPYLFDDDIEVDPDIVFGGVFPYFPMLKELVVDYELLQFDQNHVRRLSRKCPVLKALSITTPDAFDPFLIPHIIQEFPHLKHLQLIIRSILDEKVLEELIKCDMKLLTFKLCSTHWTEEMMFRLFESCEFLRFIGTHRRDLNRSEYSKFKRYQALQ